MRVTLQNSTLPFAITLSQSRCLLLLLAMSSRVYLLFPTHGYEPPPTLRHRINPHLSLSRRRFPIPVMPNARMSLCTQSGHSFPFPSRPLRNVPSRFPNMIRFLVCNIVLMLSHRVLSRARLCEVIRWSGLLCCAPMMETRPGGVRCVIWRGVPGGGPRLPRPLPFGS